MRSRDWISSFVSALQLSLSFCLVGGVGSDGGLVTSLAGPARPGSCRHVVDRAGGAGRRPGSLAADPCRGAWGG